MPRRWIDKKSATTYQLVFRPQNDPLIHDEDASERVFREIGTNNSGESAHDTLSNGNLSSEHLGLRSQTLSDLEAALAASDTASRRPNEGEAAEHGVYYDDSKYDYMQHLRDLDGASGGSVWMEAKAPATEKSDKGKGLADALEKEMQNVAIRDHPTQYADKARLDTRSVTSETPSSASIYSISHSTTSKLRNPPILPTSSSNPRSATYQDQQDTPDEIAGLQPDMDPRLREVLEALEDEAYIDSADAVGSDEQLFLDIAAGGEEISLDEYEAVADADDGWESDRTDDTAKPTNEYNSASTDNKVVLEPSHAEEGDETHGDGAFMATFRDLPKSATSKSKPHAGLGTTPSILTGSSALLGAKRKKRKGAMTSSDAYSMTSSSLTRTEALSTLDARFEKTLESYAEEDEDGFDADTSSMVSGMSGMSKTSGLSRASGVSKASGLSKVSGFSKASGMSGVSLRSTTSSQAPRLIDKAALGGVLDEFLEGYGDSTAGKGKKRGGRSGRKEPGMQQLDEIRQELGRPVGKAVTGSAR